MNALETGTSGLIYRSPWFRPRRGRCEVASAAHRRRIRICSFEVFRGTFLRYTTVVRGLIAGMQPNGRASRIPRRHHRGSFATGGVTLERQAGETNGILKSSHISHRAYRRRASTTTAIMETLRR